MSDNRMIKRGSLTVQNINDSSIHDDGIYDVDISCVYRKNKANPQICAVLMMMALLGNR